MRAHQVKLAVVTDMDGKVVATKQLVEAGAAPELAVYHRLVGQQRIDPRPSLVLPAYSRIIAGPEQQHHEVEVELPESLFVTRDVQEIHRLVQVSLDR